MSLLQIGLPKADKAPSVRVARKRRVYLMEANVVMGAFRYLPYSTGLLRAYAEANTTIRNTYQFMPFLYEMDKTQNVLAKYTEEPDVACFSCSMWNEKLTLTVAREVKKRWPKCLVIFGGCHVPFHPKEYMTENPFIDVCVRSEGEEAFKDLLLHYANKSSFTDVPDVTYRQDGEILENLGHREFSKTLDNYPSPYLTGLFDYLIREQTPQHMYQCILESNRGCPFDCSFCFWAAGGLMTKYRFHDLEYTKDEMTWTGKNRIPYVFAADSNFAMHKRDRELAEHIVETKRQYGFPEKFRVCFGKNTDEKIFQVASILHEADLEKGITLARQSNDEETLKNIRRDNIKLSTYQNLQKRFMEKGVPTYTELILGLPGETTTSWKRGVDEILTSGQLKANLFVYLCQILPNTELWRPEYREKHGIQSKQVELTEIHGSKRDPGFVTEYEELVISTNSMPYPDWREMCKFSWMTMLLHSMKSGFYVMAWLWDRFKIPPSELINKVVRHEIVGQCSGVIRDELSKWDALLDRISVFGESRGQILDGYGDIYWDVEEAALLRMAEDWLPFYADLLRIVRGLLHENSIEFDTEELLEVFLYQKLRMPSLNPTFLVDTPEEFVYNTPEYFDKLFGLNPVPLEKKPQTLTLKPKDWGQDKEKFARECILWGRKSGTMLVSCEWKEVK